MRTTKRDLTCHQIIDSPFSPSIFSSSGRFWRGVSSPEKMRSNIRSSNRKRLATGASILFWKCMQLNSINSLAIACVESILLLTNCTQSGINADSKEGQWPDLFPSRCCMFLNVASTILPAALQMPHFEATFATREILPQGHPPSPWLWGHCCWPATRKALVAMVVDGEAPTQAKVSFSHVMWWMEDVSLTLLPPEHMLAFAGTRFHSPKWRFMTVARRGPGQVLSSYPGSFSGYTVDSKEPGPSATGKKSLWIQQSSLNSSNIVCIQNPFLLGFFYNPQSPGIPLVWIPVSSKTRGVFIRLQSCY